MACFCTFSLRGINFNSTFTPDAIYALPRQPKPGIVSEMAFLASLRMQNDLLHPNC
jgi:hypothetical protein